MPVLIVGVGAEGAVRMGTTSGTLGISKSVYGLCGRFGEDQV